MPGAVAAVVAARAVVPARIGMVGTGRHMPGESLESHPCTSRLYGVADIGFALRARSRSVAPALASCRTPKLHLTYRLR